MSKRLLVVVFVVVVFACSVKGDHENNSTDSELVVFGRALVEQGRTMVHHAVKRLMIILPAIFFKLGVAFTLLLLVTVVAVNNGFIGFLILVVGLSSVLARLQEARRPSPVPIVYSPPAYVHGPSPYVHGPSSFVHGPPIAHAHHFLDRSDVEEPSTMASKSSYEPQYQNHNYDNNPDLRYTDVIYNNYPTSHKLS